MSRIINFLINLIFCAVIAYVMYTAIFGERGYKKYLSLKKERIKLENQLEKTMAERDKLSEELVLLKKDPLFVEEQIKIKLQKGKKGETFYLFEEDSKQDGNNNRK